MKLKDLLKDIPVLETNADMELDIQEIFYDSRKVQAGSLFVAVCAFECVYKNVYLTQVEWIIVESLLCKPYQILILGNTQFASLFI